MLHNETINIWSHLIGVLIFALLVQNTYDIYEPSDFYYHNLVNNMPGGGYINMDFGVKFDKFQ